MKGICFVEPLFNMVINGTKTQVREIVKPQPDFISDNFKFAKKNNGDIILPKYKIGEKLYLKEPYYKSHTQPLCYKYDETVVVKWQNKLFMPAKYARYFIEITGVRCERLQNITDKDCMKEGIEELNAGEIVRGYPDYVQYSSDNGVTYFDTPREAYAELINKINGKGTWESNPYVWVYDFKLVK